jgi:L-rhamnose mutarotase
VPGSSHAARHPRLGAGCIPGPNPRGDTNQMEHVCFLGRIRPERLEEYRARHQEVWPEMTQALQEAGWANYTLFLTDEGLLIGYLETDDYAAAQQRMAHTDVNARWQAEMQPYFADLGELRPDEGFRRVAEIFHLD